MPKINQDRGILIMARKRYGKTHLLKAMLKELRTRYTIIIYNTNYEDFTEVTTPNTCVTLEPDRERLADIDYLSETIKKIRAHMSNFILVIIDLDKFFDGTGSQTNKAKELKDLWGTGGHQRIMPIIEAKMPRYIPPKVIANNNLFYIGQFKDPVDQVRLQSYATREELSGLTQPEFIEVDDWTNTRRIIVVQNGIITPVRDLPDRFATEARPCQENTNQGAEQGKRQERRGRPRKAAQNIHDVESQPKMYGQQPPSHPPSQLKLQTRSSQSALKISQQRP
jgi:hypothetical protein